MPLFVYREVGLYLRIQFDQELGDQLSVLPLMQIDRVDTYQRLSFGVVDHEDAHIGGKSSGEGVTSDG